MKPVTIRRQSITLILTALLTVPVFADADVEAGKALANKLCAACHGPKGISPTPANPNLAGQKAVYTAKQLRDFKSGARKDPVMSAMAKPLSEDDINNLAAYYAELNR